MTLSILFDLDGTLVDTAPDLWKALNATLDHHGAPHVAFETVGYLAGRGALPMIERGLAAGGHRVDADTLKALHRVFLDHYAANIAVGSRPFPGVVACLDAFAAQGHRLAVCTNKFEALSRQLLDALGLSSRFGVIAGPDTFMVKKPDPEHILKTIAAAGGTPDRAVMIGDSITDIAAAKAAGVPVVAVDFGYSDVPVTELEPDAVIGHFDALPAAIDAVLRKRGAA